MTDAARDIPQAPPALPMLPSQPVRESSVRHRPRFNARWAGLVLMLACAAPLAVALYLSADSQGHSTHTQLGLPPCGMLKATSIPCMTCGMTTSFTHAAHGKILTAFATQPAGALLSLLCAVGVIIGGYCTAMGVSLVPLGRRLWTPQFVIAGLTVLLAAWGYKILIVRGFMG